jgi:hypothetical protein
MSAEHMTGHEAIWGEFEFSRVMSAFKTKFTEAIDQQSRLENYRLFLVQHIEEVPDAIARFRLMDKDHIDDLQEGVKEPDSVIDIGLPIAYVDIDTPVLLSETPLNQGEYFVLFSGDMRQVINSTSIQATILDQEPGFIDRAVHSEVIPIRKTPEA